MPELISLARTPRRHPVAEGVNSKRLLSALLVVVLTGCISAPSPPVRDRLDAKTGSTVSMPWDPVELLSPASGGIRTVAFAYLGPFEIDRMGVRTLFLWVLVPNDVSHSSPPLIQCDGQVVDLPVLTSSLSEMGLSQSPYEPPYPWSRQWYFALTDAALACFAGAHVIALEIPHSGAEPTRFTVESAKEAVGFPVLQAFVAHRGD
jgi:hypothetical protein